VLAFIYRHAHSPRFNVVALFYSSRWHNFGRARRYYIADSACFISSSSFQHAQKYVARSRDGKWHYACPLATFNPPVSREAVFELVQSASADLMLTIWTVVTSASGQTNSFRQSPGEFLSFINPTKGQINCPFPARAFFARYARSRICENVVESMMRVVIFVWQNPVSRDLRARANPSLCRATIRDECKLLWNILLPFRIEIYFTYDW